MNHEFKRAGGELWRARKESVVMSGGASQVIETQRVRESESQRHRETERQRVRESESQRVREAERQRDGSGSHILNECRKLLYSAPLNPYDVF